MSKFEKNLKKYINENLKHDSQYDSIVAKANLQSKKKERRTSFMKKNVLRFVLPSVLCVLLVVGIIVGVSLSGKPTDKDNDNNNNNPKPAAVIQMDVNPSISFVVDENNVVLSVYGQNDDGKLVINGETIVGLTIEDAVEKVITIEVNTGYIKKEVQEHVNNISFKIESEKEEVLTKLETKLNEATEKICDELQIEEKITVAKEKAKDNLVVRAMAIDPTLTQEEAEDMTSEELVKYIMGCQIEKVEIPTEELEKFYNNVKTTRISFVEKEETKKLIDTLGNNYVSFKERYSELLDELKEASANLDSVYYDNFISEESNIKKAYVEIANYKKELAEKQAELDALPADDLNRIALQAEITLKQNMITGLETNLPNVETLAKQAFDFAKQTLDGIIAQMEAKLNELPADIKADLNNKLVEVENKVNEAKDNSFKYFEENYRADIETAIAKLEEEKANLVDELK